MPEDATSGGSKAAEADRVPDLNEDDLRKLCDLVYRLLRDEIVIEKERRGAPPLRDRR